MHHFSSANVTRCVLKLSHHSAVEFLNLTGWKERCGFLSFSYNSTVSIMSSRFFFSGDVYVTFKKGVSSSVRTSQQSLAVFPSTCLTRNMKFQTKKQTSNGDPYIFWKKNPQKTQISQKHFYARKRWVFRRFDKAIL